ncbi:MAG: RNA-binding S4 domain-containing protein [Bacilli bacterium]|nr:RNA-binding S4 domain-containing protein [Bacilli bacterium]
MRLDKFLKVSRIFKRRTVAKEIALHDRILVNDRIAKPSTVLKPGDSVRVSYKDKHILFKVLNLSQHASKEQAESMYEIIEESGDK